MRGGGSRGAHQGSARDIPPPASCPSLEPRSHPRTPIHPSTHPAGSLFPGVVVVGGEHRRNAPRIPFPGRCGDAGGAASPLPATAGRRGRAGLGAPPSPFCPETPAGGRGTVRSAVPTAAPGRTKGGRGCGGWVGLGWVGDAGRVLSAVCLFPRAWRGDRGVFPSRERSRAFVSLTLGAGTFLEGFFCGFFFIIFFFLYIRL